MMSDEKKSPAVWDVKCTSADCRYGPYNVCHYRGPHPSVDGRCTYEGCPIRADCEEKLAEAEGRAKKASDMSQTVIDGQLVRIGELEGELQIMAGARDSLGVELRDLEEKVRELRDRLKRCQTVTENKKAQEAYHNVEFDLTEILKDTEPEGVDAKPEPPETPSTTDEPEPCEDCGGIGAHMEGCPEKKEVL